METGLGTFLLVTGIGALLTFAMSNSRPLFEVIGLGLLVVGGTGLLLSLALWRRVRAIVKADPRNGRS